MAADTAGHHTASLQRRISAEWLIMATALSLLSMAITLLQYQPLIRSLNVISYDFSLQAGRSVPATDEIVIIAIDDASIEALGYWPWPRSVHAALLDRLQGARAVGLDLILSEPHPLQPDEDRMLAQAVARHGRVALPEILSPDGLHLTRPLPALARASAAMGRIDTLADHDGILRSIRLQRSGPAGQLLPHFSLALARIAGWDKATRKALQAAPDTDMHIRFTDPRKPFTIYPYHAVLAGTVAETAFRDKVVLVGARASGLGDQLPTAMGSGLMPGVEFMANTVQNLRDDMWVRQAPYWVALPVSMLPVLFLCLFLRSMSPRGGLALSLLAILIYLLTDAFLMSAYQLWIPPAGPMIALLLAYPVWSWRSQEATLQHIDRELERLHIGTLASDTQALEEDIPHTMGTSSPGLQTDPELVGSNTLPQRAIRLHQAVSRLKQAAREQEKTLGFISHDMRSPQSAILAAIDLRRQNPDKWSETDTLENISKQAYTTLRLLDQFVQMARAESAPLNLSPCMLADLIRDCIDRRWSQASHKGIVMDFDEPEFESLISLDEDLVRRAFGNLIDNAILYTPEGGRISCSLQRSGPWWHMHVRDTGPGIPPDQVENLFTHYWRPPSGQSGKPAGSGLGLAFVQAVAQRHGGHASYSPSDDGQGSLFTISLPSSIM